MYVFRVCRLWPGTDFYNDKDLDCDIRRRAFLAKYGPTALVRVTKKMARSGLKRVRRVFQKLVGSGVDRTTDVRVSGG